MNLIRPKNKFDIVGIRVRITVATQSKIMHFHAFLGF